MRNVNIEKTAGNKICAKYENKSYTVNELEKRINDIPQFHRQKINSLELLNAAVKGIVTQDLLLKIAEEKNYDKDSEVKEVINKYNKNIFLKYKREEIHNSYQFSDSAIYDFYKN
jgi:hypothetical protein